MMIRRKKITVIVFIVILFGASVLGSVHAATDYDQKIEDAQKKKEELDRKKKQLQKEIDDLEKDKSDIIRYINKLDAKMSDVTKSLNQLKEKIAGKEAELKKTEHELKIAEREEKIQYDAMKKRIKYMYENGNTEYMDILLEAKSFSELLNRSEYISKILEYDKNMLNRYQETHAKIEKKKQAIEDTIVELTGLKEETNAEHQALRELTGNKKAELKKYNDSLEVSEEEKDKYEREAERQEAEIENLLLEKQRQIEAEEARRREQEKKNGESQPDDKYKGSSGLRWPLQVAGRISSTFGLRKSPTAGASSNHKGIDISVPAGTPIVASGSGTVVTASYSSSAGNYIMIYHGKSTSTVYMHCSGLAVSEGASVKKGQVIAYVGSTGISTGNHLHFGIMINGGYVNPLSYVSY